MRGILSVGRGMNLLDKRSWRKNIQCFSSVCLILSHFVSPDQWLPEPFPFCRAFLHQVSLAYNKHSLTHVRKCESIMSLPRLNWNA